MARESQGDLRKQRNMMLKMMNHPRHEHKELLRIVFKNNLRVLSGNTSWLGADDQDCKAFKAQRIDLTILKRALWKEDSTSIPDTFQPEHLCDICIRVSLSKVRLTSYMRSHYSQQPLSDFAQVFPQQLTVNSCQICDIICRSVVDLWRHINERFNVNAKENS